MKVKGVYALETTIFSVEILNDLDPQIQRGVNYIILPSQIFEEQPDGNLRLIRRGSEYDQLMMAILSHLANLPQEVQPPIVREWARAKNPAIVQSGSRMGATLTAKKRNDDGATTAIQEDQGT